VKTVTTHSLGTDYQETLKIGDFEILLDSEVETGGGDKGPTPHDLLTGALLGCKSMTMRMYAKRKGWDLTGLKLSANQIKVDRKHTRFEVQIQFPDHLDQEQKDRLIDISGRCPVHLSIVGQVDIEAKEAPVD
tara:strand:- start:5393 stop:5791 length:399 start_codon:yes stop_codon:yes gene_type:complete